MCPDQRYIVRTVCDNVIWTLYTRRKTIKLDKRQSNRKSLPPQRRAIVSRERNTQEMALLGGGYQKAL